MKYYIIFEFHSKKTFLFLGGFRNRLLGTNHSVFIYIYAEKSENIANNSEIFYNGGIVLLLLYD